MTLGRAANSSSEPMGLASAFVTPAGKQLVTAPDAEPDSEVDVEGASS